MYKIGIDARLYSQTGVGVYLKNLLYFLEKNTNQGIFFYIYLLPEDYSKVKFTSKYFIKKLTHSRWHTFSEQIDFARLLYKDNLDLAHFTYFSYPILYKKKFIATVHDTTPLSFKTGKASTKNPLSYELKFRAFQFVISQQIKNAIKVITPSKTVKKQLLNLYGKSIRGLADKIVPIYEGVDYELMKLEVGGWKLDENIKKSAILKRLTSNSKPLFIYVGNFYPHKNVENLIKAFAKVSRNAQLILIGPDDYFSKRLTQLINQLSQGKRIVFYHNPSKTELIYFYKNASALIHPSLSEGFGLPIIEAAYFNLPIIASDIEVFRELLGRSYISFNSLSIDDITKKINQFLSQRKKVDYANLLKKFSFEKMARQVYNLYQQMLVKPTGDRR